MKFSKERLLVLVLMGVICSCSRDQVVPLSAPTYIKAVYSLPLTLDPVQMNDTASLVVSNMIYDGLLRFTPDFEFQGAIAESWSTENHGRRYVFQIRANAKFHDGSEITASDVINSLSRTIAKKSTVYKYYDCIIGAKEYHDGANASVSGLKREGKNKVTIDLKFPFPPFLSVLAGATAKILPRSVDSDRSFFKHPIGSGAFKFVEIKKGKNDELRLSRFEDYYGPKPKIEKMVLRSLSQGDAEAQAKTGEVYDLSNYPLAGSEPIFKNGADIQSPVAATWIIGFNTRIAPFNSIALRKAFKAAVDSEGFRKTFYPDALTAYGYIPKGLAGYSPETQIISKAERPKSYKHIEVAFPSVLEHHAEMRAYLEESLKKQGWDVTFIPMDWEKMMEAYDKKTLQAFVLSMNMDYPDTEFLTRNFESDNPDSFSGIKNRELDTMIRKARSTQDRVSRDLAYKGIVAKLEDLAVTVNLFHPKSHNWVSHCVKNFTPNMLADYYIDYSSVEVDSNCIKHSKAQL